MRFPGTAVSFIFSYFILPGFSQSDTVTIKGTVTDYYTKKGFPGISIINPKELEKPEVDAFQSPISALYELLSARAHEREKLKQQMTDDNRRKVLRELLSYYNENGLIDLPEDHYDDFINFSNLSLNFLK